jgi:hypothetical protein
VITHLPTIILVLGAAIVPLLLWLSASGRRRAPFTDARQPEGPLCRPVSRTEQEPSSHAMQQIRPDGVVLDWRAGSPRASLQGLSVRTVGDTTPPR